MFEQPTKREIDYALSMLMHEARRQVADEKNRITFEAAKAGALHGSRVVVAMADAADKIHAASMVEAKRILIDFVQRMEKPAKEITAWARPHLENMSSVIICGIPSNGFPDDHRRIIAQYQAVFHQRIEGALREIEIGYVRGTGFVTRDNTDATMLQEAEPTPLRLSDALTLKPTFMGISIDLSKVWRWLSQGFHRTPHP